MIKNIIATILIAVGAFGDSMVEYIGTFSKPDVKILEIAEPTPIILTQVNSISLLVTDDDDRAKLAIFNYQFANNVSGYKATVQQANDVYVLAGKIFFKDSMMGKYEGLSGMIISLIESTTTNDNHLLTDEEKKELSAKFMGVSWVLTQ